MGYDTVMSNLNPGPASRDDLNASDSPNDASGNKKY